MGIGQYISLVKYCGPHTTSSVLIIHINIQWYFSDDSPATPPRPLQPFPGHSSPFPASQGDGECKGGGLETGGT